MDEGPGRSGKLYLKLNTHPSRVEERVADF